MNEENGNRRLIRPQQGRLVAGVCAGLGAYLALDPNVIRLVFAVLTVFGGMGALAYLLAWIVIPEEGESASIAENLIRNKLGG